MAMRMLILMIMIMMVIINHTANYENDDDDDDGDDIHHACMHTYIPSVAVLAQSFHMHGTEPPLTGLCIHPSRSTGSSTASVSPEAPVTRGPSHQRPQSHSSRGPSHQRPQCFWMDVCKVSEFNASPIRAGELVRCGGDVEGDRGRSAAPLAHIRRGEGNKK